MRGFYTDPSRADDSFIPFKSAKKIGTYSYSITNPETKTFDCTSISGYKKLTADNFIIQLNSIGRKENANYAWEPIYTSTFSKSYNSIDGILSIEFNPNISGVNSVGNPYGYTWTYDFDLYVI